ncbi:MAG: HD domain-containing protein [Candidatus Glassbacteria bacterium]|nr:HD domain-containing protein [Candidatus Glassbacteria bacterium]
MLIHTDHLVPDMELDKDIELKAGSYLITRRDLGDGRLNAKVIESIRKFSGQIVPYSHKVFIKDNKFALGYLKKIVDEDLYRIAKTVVASKNAPNFLADIDLHEKVMRIMEMLFSNPDIIRTMYDARFNSEGKSRPLDLIIDHSIRTSLLAVALGLKLRCSVISLVSIGMAALLHDMGIISTPAFPGLEALDEMSDQALVTFIEQHQVNSARLLQERKLNISPYQRNEVFHIVANHHSPDLRDTAHKNTLIFHFADLLDEMASHLPHGIRYNFTPDQIHILGKGYSRRNGLVNVLLGLTRLYRQEGGLTWEIITSLAALLRLEQVLKGDFREKMQAVLDDCPLNCARLNPPLEGNTVPRTVYCGRSTEKGFSCEHLVYLEVKIQDEKGRMDTFLKCGTLGNRLEELNHKDDR